MTGLDRVVSVAHVPQIKALIVCIVLLVGFKISAIVGVEVVNVQYPAAAIAAFNHIPAVRYASSLSEGGSRRNKPPFLVCSSVVRPREHVIRQIRTAIRVAKVAAVASVLKEVVAIPRRFQGPLGIIMAATLPLVDIGLGIVPIGDMEISPRMAGFDGIESIVQILQIEPLVGGVVSGIDFQIAAVVLAPVIDVQNTVLAVSADNHVPAIWQIMASGSSADLSSWLNRVVVIICRNKSILVAAAHRIADLSVVAGRSKDIHTVTLGNVPIRRAARTLVGCDLRPGRVRRPSARLREECAW